MMQLKNSSKNQIISSQLEVAKSVLARMQGLLGRDSISQESALWITPCNNIHTWFMKFPIDAVFVDRKLIVKSVHSNIQPWRLIWPQIQAHSVFELPAGRANATNIQPGDQLDVVT
jgi:uncharacterized protein